MMNSRKIWAIFLVICMVFTFAACGVRSSDDDEDNGSKTSSKDKGGLLSELVDDDDRNTDNNDNDDDRDTRTDDEDDSGDDRNTGNEDDEDNGDDRNTQTGQDEDEGVYNPLEGLESAELPDGYPEQEYPFFNGTVVSYAIRDTYDGATRYIVLCSTPASLDELKAFYNQLLKDAEDRDEDEGSEYKAFFGIYSGYRFGIGITSDPQNKKYCQLSIELKEIPSVESVLASLEGAELTEGYPSDLFPIIEGSAIYESSMYEYDGIVESYDLSAYTSQTFKDIIIYYEDFLGDIEDKYKNISSDGFELSGYANGHYFVIKGWLENVMDIDLTHYYISLEPLEE